MKLHERVRSYRINHGITQTWVADQVGISVKTLNGIELGRQRMAADLFEAICTKGLSVNPKIFFEDTFLETKSGDISKSNFRLTGTEGGV